MVAEMLIKPNEGAALKSWSKRIVQCAIFCLAFVLGFGVSTSWGAATHSLRKANHTAVDGVRADIEGNLFYAPSNACVIYAVYMVDEQGTNHHLESGLVRCGSSASSGIMGTCPSGHAFAERWDGTGSGFFCNPGGNFDNNVKYSSYIRRGTSGDWTPTAYILGAEISQSGFNPADTTRAIAWGEVTSGASSTTCPTGNARGTFYAWKRLVYSGGVGSWGIVTNSTDHAYNVGVSGAPCWAIESVTWDGEFSVY